MILTARDGRSATWLTNWLTFFWPTPPEVVCMGDLARRPDSLVEAEAAHLGGCILVPNEAAYRLAVSGIDNSRAADIYGVSDEMITYRLRMSGALKRVGRHA